MIPIALAILGALAPHAGDIVGGIASMFGGKNAESVAKSVVDKATSVFGTSDPEKIKLLIAQDATLAQKYIAEVQADTEQFRIQVADVQDARRRDIEIRKIATDEKGTPAGTNTRANVMLIGAFMCFVIIIGGTMQFRASIPDGVLAILQTATGSLLTMLTLAFNFEFGSSRGSSEKSNQIADMANSASAIATTAANAAARKQ